MSTFQAAFLNEVIYVTNARFKESKEGLKREINAFEGNHPTSIVERPIGPVKVSFLTKLRKTGFAATRMPFFNQPTSRPATESYHVKGEHPTCLLTREGK